MGTGSSVPGGKAVGA